MKRWIHAATEVVPAYNRFKNPDRAAVMKAARKAAKIVKDNGYFGVCYAVRCDKLDELTYDTDGCLFYGETYDDYRKAVKTFCNGNPERWYTFESKFNPDNEYLDIYDIDWQLFDAKQQEVIKDGLNSGVDVSYYADPVYSAGQMQAILNGLKRGLDVSVYNDPKKSTAIMNKYFEGMLSKAKERGLL